MNENNNTENLQKSRISLLVKVQVVIAAIAIIVTIIAALQIIPLIERKTNLEEEIAELERERTAKIAELEQIKNELKRLTPLAKKGLGYKPEKVSEDPSIPETSLQAVDAANQILSHSDNARRSDITIVVYAKQLEKEVNTNVVIPSLQELGFRIIKRTSALQSVQTNTIWFGPNVNMNDVKLVAYQLIGAGLPIKTIRPFRNPQAKASRIEIGGDASIVNRPVLTVEQIRTAPEFTRDNEEDDGSVATSQ